MARFFDFGHLEKYLKNICIIIRSESVEQICTYNDVLDAAKQFHIKCIELEIPRSSGFAIKLKNGHTASSVVILLSILNHGCYFCPLQAESTADFLFESTASYFLSDDELEYKNFHCELKQLTVVEIFNVKFCLYKLMKHQTVKLPNSMCYTIGTSGTSGTPKMVHVNYDCIAPNIHALCEIFKLTNEDVIFFGTPLTFDPSIVELFMALKCGAALLITTADIRLSPDKLIKVLWPLEKEKKQSATVLQMTPSLFRQFGVDAIRNTVFNENCALRILVLGGEEFPIVTELQSWFPDNSSLNKRIFNIYGITELSCWATIFECQNFEDSIPIGDPIDSETFLRIASTNNEAEKGELLVGSVTRKTFIPLLDKSHHLENDILYRHTGDLVERNKSTGAIHYIGRLNNSIKRFGQKICLESLERKIHSHLIKLEDVVVVCLWHEDKKQLICCIKTTASLTINNNFATTAKELINKLLPSYEKPDHIVEITELPLNTHGKVDRKCVLKKIVEFPVSQKPTLILRRFLQETLNIDISNIRTESQTVESIKRQKIEINSDIEMKSFTALGGTSFHALSLATEIGEFLNYPNDQRILLEYFLSSNTTIVNILHFLEDIEKRQCSTKTDSKSNFSLPKTSVKSKKFQFLWRMDMKKCIDATPAVDTENNCICVGSHSHLLATFDVCTGKEIASLNLHNRIECEVSFVSNELALVGCNAGYLYAYNYRTSELIWSIYIGSKVKAKPLVVGLTHAIVGCYEENFNLVKVCLKSQQIEWRRKVGTKPINSAPVQIEENSAIVATLDGSVELFEILTGKALWTQKLESPIFSTPTSIFNGTEFIIAEVRGLIHLCKTENGNVLHTFEVTGNIFSNITVFQKNETSIQILFGSHDHNVYCLNYVREVGEELPKPDLKLNWSCALNSGVYATPILIHIDSADYVVACSTKGLIVLLEASSGVINTSYTVNGEVFSTPRFIKIDENDFRICFGCRDNFLYCFNIL